jgi:hypothetical protein
MNRTCVCWLLFAIVAGSVWRLSFSPIVTCAHAGSPIINGADYSNTTSLVGNLSLTRAGQTISPRIVVEYAQTMFQLPIKPPQGFNVTVSPRIIVQYADFMTMIHTHVACDLNTDGKTDMIDIGWAAKAFGSTPGKPNWNMVADVNGDAYIDMKDIGTIARHFGQKYT